MNNIPLVSVVMSTFNDTARLAASIDSVLAQECSDLEFIIVNDGSAVQETEGMLTSYARQDGRIKVISKPNEGLTRALIDGCALAQGDYISRIDVGDSYLPGRLGLQVDYMGRHPDVVINSCGTRFLTPEDDILFECSFNESPKEATRKLRAEKAPDIRGVTHHGATLFRRADYVAVGGYRTQFYFAQDLDLWMRLTERGYLSFIPEILYEARFTPWGISGGYAPEQRKLSELIVVSRCRREAMIPDDDVLAMAARIRPPAKEVGSRPNRIRQARGFYFMAQMLRRNGNVRCRDYYARAIQCNPLHLRALAGLCITRL